MLKFCVIRYNFASISKQFHQFITENAIFPINNAARAEAFPLQSSLFFTLLYVSLLLCHAGFNRVGKFLALQAA